MLGNVGKSHIPLKGKFHELSDFKTTLSFKNFIVLFLPTTTYPTKKQPQHTTEAPPRLCRGKLKHPRVVANRHPKDHQVGRLRANQTKRGSNAPPKNRVRVQEAPRNGGGEAAEQAHFPIIGPPLQAKFSTGVSGCPHYLHRVLIGLEPQDHKVSPHHRRCTDSPQNPNIQHLDLIQGPTGQTTCSTMGPRHPPLDSHQ